MEELFFVGIFCALGFGGIALCKSFDRCFRGVFHPFWDAEEEQSDAQRQSIDTRPR